MLCSRLDGLEQCLEVALAKAERFRGARSARRTTGAVLHRLGEDLQQVAVLVTVGEDLQLAQRVDRHAGVADHSPRVS